MIALYGAHQGNLITINKIWTGNNNDNLLLNFQLSVLLNHIYHPIYRCEHISEYSIPECSSSNTLEVLMLRYRVSTKHGNRSVNK